MPRDTKSRVLFSAKIVAEIVNKQAANIIFLINHRYKKQQLRFRQIKNPKLLCDPGGV